MIHTAIPYALFLTLLAASAGAQGEAGKSTQDTTIKQIIDAIKQREKTLKAVELELSSRGSYPSQLQFEAHGTIRVLGTTHFHIDVDSRFDDADGVRCELEKVITPDGVWTRQKGPSEEVYTRMDKVLMDQLKAAQAKLADRELAMRNPGPLAGQGEAPLGSAMLTALDQQFDLKIEPNTQILKSKQLGDVECRVLKGRWRGFAGLNPDEITTADHRAVHRVEIYLRAADGIPIRMVQFNRGGKTADGKDAEAEAYVFQIEKLRIDPKLDAAEFVLHAPEGTSFIDVKAHPPSRAQINRILQEAKDRK